MKSLQQMLAKQNEEELERFAKLWAIENTPHDGWIHHRTSFLQRFDDIIAARFAWERLSQDERVLLYNILGPARLNWAEREVLAKKVQAQLPGARFEAALAALKERFFLEEEAARMQGDQLLDARAGYYSYGYYGSKNKKKPVRDITILYVPQEISDAFYRVSQEVFAAHDELPPERMTLEQVLLELPPSNLNAISNHYGWMPYGGAQSSARGLSQLLLQPDRLAYTLGRLQLEPAILELLRWLRKVGGRATMQEVRKQIGDEGQLSAVLHLLADYALAFDRFKGQERVLFVPGDIYKILVDSASLPRAEYPIGLVPLSSPPALVYSGDTLTYNDVAVLIGAIYQQNIEPTKAGTVPKRTAAKIAPLLSGIDRKNYEGEEYLYLEILLYEMRRMGLVQLSKPSLSDGKEHYVPGPDLAQWARMDVLEQSRYLLSCWLTSHNWIDVPGANYRTGYTMYYSTTSSFSARGPLLGYLKSCTPGTWYTMDSLLNTIHGTEPFILHPHERGAIFRDKRRQQDLEEHWETRDAEQLMGMLSSSLYELGIVALGYQGASAASSEHPVNPDAFMLTELGATLLNELAAKNAAPTTDDEGVPGGSDLELEEIILLTAARKKTKAKQKTQGKQETQEVHSPKPERSRSLIVQPNFELLLMQPDLPTLYRLLPLAQINSLGNVSRLTLTRSSVLRGLGFDSSIEQILQVLEEHSQKGIPQNVDYTLRDWAKAYRAVQVSSVILIEVENEAHANELLALPKLKTYHLRRLGPTFLAVSKDVNLTELRRTMEKEGIVFNFAGSVTTTPGRPPGRSTNYGYY